MKPLFRCPHCGHATRVALRYLGKTGPCVQCGHTVDVPDAPAYRRQRNRVALVFAMALSLSIGHCLLAMYFSDEARYLFSQPRGPSRSMYHRHYLRCVGLSVLNYDEFHRGQTEPDGAEYAPWLEPGQRLSWLTRILPQLERNDLYHQLDFDEPWDSPRNRRVTREDIECLHAVSWESQPGHTAFVGIGGLGNDAPNLPPTHPRAGFFGYGRIARLSQVADGAANTILVADTQNTGPWAQGGHATVRPLDSRHPASYTGPGGQFGNDLRVTVMLGDGHVRTIGPSIDPKVFEALSTLNGGEQVPDYPY